MRLLCITDPLTHPHDDATVVLYSRLAVDPRFELFHLEVSRVGGAEEVPVLRIRAPLSFQEFRSLASQPTTQARITDFDLVFSRADKPYPPDFLLSLIRHEGKARFVARPSSVLECDVRTFYRRHASAFLAPGLVTRDLTEASRFVRATGSVVAKRNRSYGGKGVSRIWRQGPEWRLQHGRGEAVGAASLEELLESLLAIDPEPWEFVKYLQNVSAGDKRVLVVEGEIYGAFLRMATDGSWINNLTTGGTSLAATVTPAEAAVVQATCGIYHQRGLYALGYDFLMGDSGGWVLSEINASGNIGGYHRVEETSGVPVVPRLLDWLLEFAAR